MDDTVFGPGEGSDDAGRSAVAADGARSARRGEVDWVALRGAATEAMLRAYAPYSGYPVGAAALVDDGRTVVGANVENASYGLTLCAECGLVSALHTSGGGRLVALACVDGRGQPILPCGRCRQLIWEHGGARCQVDTPDGPVWMNELLPYAFDAGDLSTFAEAGPAPERDPVLSLPIRLREWHGQGTVFVHPDVAEGERVWTAYWERSSGFTDAPDTERGILEEGPTWTEVGSAVGWGRLRTDRVVVVDVDGGLSWAGPGEPPVEVNHRWETP